MGSSVYPERGTECHTGSTEMLWGAGRGIGERYEVGGGLMDRISSEGGKHWKRTTYNCWKRTIYHIHFEVKRI